MMTEKNPLSKRLRSVTPDAFRVSVCRGGQELPLLQMNPQVCWIIWTNTDLTEGRGSDYPYGISTSYSAAARAAKGVGVVGSPGRIEASVSFTCDVSVEEGMMDEHTRPTNRQKRLRFWPVDVRQTRFFEPSAQDIKNDMEGIQIEKELEQEIRRVNERARQADARAAALRRARELGMSPEEIALLSS